MFDIEIDTEFDIGNYHYAENFDRDDGYRTELRVGRLIIRNQRVKKRDQRLHRCLDKIFRERCLGSSDQMKQFLREPQYNIDLNHMINLILERELNASRTLKEELGKRSFLWRSILAGYTDSAELLVRHGADVNETFGRHRVSVLIPHQVIDEKLTILHVLLLQVGASPENERLIRLVTDHGADLNVRDSNGQTILHYAARGGRVQITQVLLEKGADVNAADNRGVSPLLFAAKRSEANELLPLLIEHGADIFAKDSKGRNAWHYLTNSPEEHIKLARVLIEKGVPIEENTEDRYQMIHLAAISGKNKLINIFLDNGANVNAQNKDGESPLYWAVMRSKNPVVDTLLKRGATTELRNNDGHTALHAVCIRAQTATSEEFLHEDSSLERTMNLLLSAGANVLAEDYQKRTPFALILLRGHVNLGTKLLIKELALKKALQPSIELTDERIIESFPKTKTYYRECIEEIERMKVTKFINTCTFFQLFAKSDRQIADLMRNPKFESEFKKHDLKGLIYAENLRRAFERAQKRYHVELELIEMINEAFYYTLPELIVRRVVFYILL